MSISSRALVLGVGNLLWADEGFGVRAVEAFAEAFAAREDVTVADGGTQGLYLVDLLREHCTVESVRQTAGTWGRAERVFSPVGIGAQPWSGREFAVRSGSDFAAGSLLRLRAPDGCPWDREQTMPDLGSYLREEADEVSRRSPPAIPPRSATSSATSSSTSSTPPASPRRRANSRSGT